MSEWVKVAAAALVVGVAALVIEAVDEPWQTGLTAMGSVVLLYVIWEFRDGG